MPPSPQLDLPPSPKSDLPLSRQPNNMPCTYQVKWSTNPKYSAWIAGSPKGHLFARCKLCCTDLDIISIGASALSSHIMGQKHIQLLDVYLNTSSVVDISKTERVASQTVKDNECMCV